jgi:hypothetical protein
VSNEKRRLAIEFGIGQGDSEKPDGYEDLNIAAPEPDSLLSPEWQAAIDGLGFGSVEPLIEALESAEPIPPEWETFLALALRGDRSFPFGSLCKARPLWGRSAPGDRANTQDQPVRSSRTTLNNTRCTRSGVENSSPRPCEAIGACFFG